MDNQQRNGLLSKVEYELNKLIIDEYGRVKSGVIAVNKPAGVTSHDVVDMARRVFSTKKIGHAGTLDPFATGLLILLVGKATRLADRLTNQDKTYIAEVLWGIRTDSGDPEGNILDISTVSDPPDLETIFPKFEPSYEQFVPVFSSVKVGGEKLRVLARKADSFELKDNGESRIAIFKLGDKVKEVEIPRHKVEIKMEYLGDGEVKSEDLASKIADQLGEEYRSFKTSKIKIDCSKGTYIRVLAEDIGAEADPPVPSMLIGLVRTRIGDTELVDAVDASNLSSLLPSQPPPEVSPSDA